MNFAALLAKMVSFVGSRLVAAALGFMSQVLLARLLPIDQVGVVLLGMSAAAFIALAANGGYALLAMTQLPKLAAHGRSALAEAFNRVAMRDSVVAYLLLCVTGAFVMWIGGFTTGQNTALVFGFLCAPASIIIRYNASVAMAAKYFKTSYMPDFLFRPAAFLVGLVIASFVGVLHGPLAALSIFVFVTYLTAVGQAFFLRGKAIGLRHLTTARPRFARNLRARAFAMTLVSAMMLAFADIVVLLSGFILPESDVAIIGIAMRLAAIAGFVLQAGQTLVMTDFTQALVRRDEALVTALLKRINISTIAIVLAALVGALLLGDTALRLFGEEYRAGKGLLVLFLVGQCIRALGGMNQHILSINGFQLRTAGACLLSLAALALLAVAFAKVFGPIGIGYAVVVTELVWLVLLAWQSAKFCGRRGDLLWVLQRG
jgi:O-antigen/teichoic acid export membrane protein